MHLGELDSSYGDKYPEAPSKQWKYYNIMLLEWRDEIVERRGLGYIFHQAGDHSLAPGPVWKEIFLA
jgi:hypothetical protein